eukprot:91945_1
MNTSLARRTIKSFTKSISRRRGMRIAIYNTNGWNEQIKTICKKVLKTDLTCVNELHLKDDPTITNDCILSGNTSKDDKYAGVGFLLNNPNVKQSITTVNNISNRLMSMRMKLQNHHLTVFTGYMPYKGHKVVKPEEWVDSLRNQLLQTNKNDVIIIGVDFNSQLGRNGYGVGRYNKHKYPCSNGKLVHELMEEFELVAISTYFKPRKSRSTGTWIDKYNQSYQIDHILVNKRWASSIRNSKMNWNVTLHRFGYKRDHCAITIDLNLRFAIRKDINGKYNRKKFKNKQLAMKYDNIIKDEIQKHYENVRITIDDHKPSEGDEMINNDKKTIPIEKHWNKLKDIALKAASSTFTNDENDKIYKHSHYIRDETLKLIEERKNYQSILREDETLRKMWSRKISKSIKKDENEYTNNILSEINKLQYKNDPRLLFNEINKIIPSKPNKIGINISKDENDIPYATETEKLKSWENYLKNKFTIKNEENRVAKQLLRDIEIKEEEKKQYETDTLPVTNDYTMKELNKALKQRANGKATSQDNICVELIKLSETLKYEILNMINNIKGSKDYPKDWIIGDMLNIYKKGNKDDRDNYRMICLLAHTLKLHTTMIKNRLIEETDEDTSDIHNGFRRGRGCRDNYFIINYVMNYMINILNKEFYITFVDFKQFFDTTYHEWIYYALKFKNVSESLINEIKNIYNRLQVQMRGMNRQYSGLVPVQRGFLQGDILSPNINVIGLDVQYSHIDKQNRLQIAIDWWLRWMFYADDLGDLAEKLRDAQANILELKERSQIAGNIINIKKTKLMKCMKKLQIKTNEKQIEEYINKNKNKMHQCDVCQALFPTKSGLHMHKKRWCKYNCLCHTCGRILKNKLGLFIHKRIWCGKTNSSKNDILLWSELSAEEKLNTIKYDKKRHGQKIHKILKNSIEKDIISKQDSIYLDDKRIETVTQFKYVGSILRYDGSNEQEIDTRIILARQALYGLRNLLRTNRINPEFKIRLIKIYVMSVLFNNCIGWLITPKMCRKIERLGNTCASYVYNTDLKDELVSNEGGKSFILFMIKQRWYWLRHCMLSNENRNIYKTMIKGRELKYSIWTGIRDEFSKLRTMSIIENRWEREFERRKEQLYKDYLNLR